MTSPLPCPFCGGEPVIEPPKLQPPHIDHWLVICDNDQCPAHPVVVIGPSEVTAIGNWNRRALPNSPGGVGEGWKLVPSEPTDEMLHASQAAMKNFIRGLTKEERKARGFPDVCGKHGYRIKPYEKAALRYRAMLAAAPARALVTAPTAEGKK